MDSGWYSFVDGCEDLKVVLIKKGPHLSCYDEILVTDRDLKITHKFNVDNLQRSEEPTFGNDMMELHTFPRSILGKKLILKIGHQAYNFAQPGQIFLLDLVDLSLTRMVAEHRCSEEVLEAEGGEVAMKDAFRITLWGPNFLMLDEYVYRFD